MLAAKAGGFVWEHYDEHWNINWNYNIDDPSKHLSALGIPAWSPDGVGKEPAQPEPP